MQTQGSMTQFPFKLDDLQSWTLKRVDGTITKFVLTQYEQGKKAITGQVLGNTSTSSARTTTSLGAYCSHVPTQIPIVEFDSSTRPEGLLRLWIAGMSGAKTTKDTFDFVIDGGDVISIWGSTHGAILTGDDILASSLASYVTKAAQTRVLKIDWDDRQAPPVSPEFWVELNKQLFGDVMTCCVGGHGRSGSAFVCLLLVNAPDYNAKDAIIHLRAVHCPRAIESVVQWEYIDKVAAYLGREANAKEAMAITNYADAFAKSNKPTAVATRKMLKESLEKVTPNK